MTESTLPSQGGGETIELPTPLTNIDSDVTIKDLLKISSTDTSEEYNADADALAEKEGAITTTVPINGPTIADIYSKLKELAAYIGFTWNDLAEKFIKHIHFSFTFGTELVDIKEGDWRRISIDTTKEMSIPMERLIKVENYAIISFSLKTEKRTCGGVLRALSCTSDRIGLMFGLGNGLTVNTMMCPFLYICIMRIGEQWTLTDLEYTHDVTARAFIAGDEYAFVGEKCDCRIDYIEV